MRCLALIGMIFVPRAGGINHSPLETVLPEGIRAVRDAPRDLARKQF
jgi:hypothetical protein